MRFCAVRGPVTRALLLADSAIGFVDLKVGGRDVGAEVARGKSGGRSTDQSIESGENGDDFESGSRRMDLFAAMGPRARTFLNGLCCV